MRILMILVVLLSAALVLPHVGFAEEPAAGDGEATKAVPQNIPKSESQRSNPVPRRPESVKHGAELFLTQCTMCHGMHGDGQGDLVDRLSLKVPDMTQPEIQKKRTDGDLFYILTQGHGDMPGDGERLPAEWRWDIINYIRTLDD
jgi:mono/diheme cytochrome c family protein